MLTPALDRLFQRLWADFTQINPQANTIRQLLEGRGETIINDHIAFRTFDDPRVNIDVIARPFVAEGYEAREVYRFEQKKLDARHFEFNHPSAPKIFISELNLSGFSTGLQNTVATLLDQIPQSALEDPEFCAIGRPWQLTYGDYEALARESEYAGWMAAFGFRANHFTVLVNSLKTVKSLKELNELVKEAGFPLNTEGGEIKGGPQDFLEQSSTLASEVAVSFADGTFRIPGCYQEFARRYPLPDGTLFSGFVTKSADKIFQSTDRRS
ncbi:DUF1338 domain-containing protein [Planctomicrobium sp. SH664]|uniref:DUF1338 domain-containing protein n=1 Tax=Planctomicrobium sp. SH664 TaxID=3448125 RepID=UPI003F5B9806